MRYNLESVPILIITTILPNFPYACEVLLYYDDDDASNRVTFSIQRYLKRATLNALRSIVKHNAALARSVVEMGGLEFILGCLEETDAYVKEAAAFVLGYIARQDLTMAYAVINSGKTNVLFL